MIQFITKLFIILSCATATVSLEIDPQQTTTEKNLKALDKHHKFLLHYTPRKAIKIIYFIDEPNKVVYVTDFFPCQMNDNKINKRTK